MKEDKTLETLRKAMTLAIKAEQHKFIDLCEEADIPTKDVTVALLASSATGVINGIAAMVSTEEFTDTVGFIDYTIDNIKEVAIKRLKV